MLTARMQTAARSPDLLDADGITAKWKGGECDHQNSACRARGLAATVECQDCEMGITFRLRLGKPKWFDVMTHGTANGMAAGPAGRASVQGVRGFLAANAMSVRTPDDGQDVNHPSRDTLTFDILIETLGGNAEDAVARAPVTDFAAAWREIDCNHEFVVFLMQGRTISMECPYCSMSTKFTHLGGGEFDVEMGPMGLKPEPYGRHGADEVAGFMPGFAGMLLIPEPMADRMSHDPELDARNAAKLVSALVKCGLLRRAGPPMSNFADIGSCANAGADHNVFVTAGLSMWRTARRPAPIAGRPSNLKWSRSKHRLCLTRPGTQGQPSA